MRDLQEADGSFKATLDGGKKNLERILEGENYITLLLIFKMQ